MQVISRTTKTISSLALLSVAAGLVMSSCTRKSQNDGRAASDLAGVFPMGGIDYGTQTIEARYMTWPEPDTMLVYINGVRFKVSADGFVVNANGYKFIDLDNAGRISKLFYQQKGDDLYVFFSDVTEESIISYAKRVRITDGKLVWSTLIPGMKVERPVMRGQYAYLCSFGFIGKLKLKTGQYEWRFTHLNEKGRFEQFTNIDFPERHQVRFVAPHVYSSEKDTITVNDVTGEILRIN